MSFSENILKVFGSSKKKEEFNAFSLLKSFDSTVDANRSKLKERDEKLESEIKKAKDKLEKLEKEKSLIKTLLAETA